MQSKVMSVFYGSDLLPYKDSECTVHFPIIGGAIAGSNNVTKIRFYVDKIGGTESVSWVVVSKLPNGKLGYEPISNVQIGEKYIEFDLSSYYTSVKGDLYLALRGYEGEITFEDDDDDGIYKIVGDPLIQVTGTIKLPINYSPMVNTGTQVLPTDVDRLIASLSNYIKIGDGIQIFTATNTTTFAELYAQTGTKEFILFYGNTYYIGRFNSATSIYMETISSNGISKITYSKSDLTTSDRVATLFSYNNEDRVAFGKTTIWYTYGSDTTDFDHLVQDLDYNGGHDSTKPFIFKLTGSSYGYEGYYLCQADTMGYPNCSFTFREIDGNKIFKGVVASYQTNDLRDFFNPSYLFTQTTEEYVDNEIEDMQRYVNENFLNKDDGGNVDGDVAFGGIVTVVTPTQDNEVANKGYVDNAIQEFLQNEFQAVDTTEYPTLDSFLASTGEEGYIYLYPTGVNNDYYQYIWEGSWVSLGTTQLDLSNYYTKSETDTLLNGKVDKTSTANKIYGTNDQGAQITYTVDDFYDGNIARRDSDGSITVPLTPSANGEATSKKYVDDSVATKQDILVSGTNIKTLNNESLLGSGNISYDNALSSSSTNAVQNKVITQNVLDLQYRVAMLEEAIIGEDTLSYTYLSESLIPTLSDNSYPIIQSGGLDTKEIKGRSFVYNQLVNHGNFDATTGWNKENSNISISNNVLTQTRTSGSYMTLYRRCDVIQGHKYLVKIDLSSNNSRIVDIAFLDTTYTYYQYVKENQQLTTSLTTYQFIFTATRNDAITYFMIRVKSVADGDEAQYRNAQIFDLTQSDIDSATTVDQAIALLQQNGINPYEYNEYNVGKIIDSKPTAIVSKGFNIFDKNTVKTSAGNYILDDNGNQSTDYNSSYFKEYIKVLPNTTYYATGGVNTGGIQRIYYYTYDKQWISRTNAKSTAFTFTTPSNCYFIRIQYLNSSFNGNTLCINLSSSLNGTYKPYKAPITYPLDIPVLRSARNAQDNNLKVNIGVRDLGTFDWTYSTAEQFFANAIISDAKTNTTNCICAMYVLNPNAGYAGALQNMQFKIFGNVLHVKNTSYNDADTFKTDMSGVPFLYELATPTDQPSITLPENMEIELGGSLEVLYDDGHTTPCDFVFDTAVYKPIQ